MSFNFNDIAISSTSIPNISWTPRSMWRPGGTELIDSMARNYFASLIPRRYWRWARFLAHRRLIMDQMWLQMLREREGKKGEREIAMVHILQLAEKCPKCRPDGKYTTVIGKEKKKSQASDFELFGLQCCQCPVV